MDLNESPVFYHLEGDYGFNTFDEFDDIIKRYGNFILVGEGENPQTQDYTELGKLYSVRNGDAECIGVVYLPA